MPSDAAVQEVWVWSLVAYIMVVGVVALMLTLVLQTVREIHAGAAAIWATGQKVANNTIQIPLLLKTNHLTAEMLESAGRTADAVAQVATHASTCPECPSCVTKRARGGVR